MIKATIEYLKNELVSALELGEINVSLDSLKGLPDRHGQGILFSFISINEEDASGNLPNFPIDDSKGFDVTPSLALNMRVAVVFDFNDYEKSLDCLSEVAEFFRDRGMFTIENQRTDSGFPEGLTKLFVSQEDLDLEKQAQIWTMFGNRHYPALFYNVRLINVEETGSNV